MDDYPSETKDVKFLDNSTNDADFSKPPYKPKRKYPGFRKNIKNYFTEYSGNTGIHGFNYMGEQNRSIVEKLYWLILFCISLYFCIGLIMETWIKWDTSPVLVSFARSPTPVWQIPFPAVTVCSETKTKQTVYNFTDNYYKWKDITPDMIYNLTDDDLEEYNRFNDMSLVCDDHLYHGGKNTTDFETVDFVMNIAPQFSEIFWVCKWTNQNETCTNMFTPILTEEGLCFTFNMLDKTELLTDRVFSHGDYMSSDRNSEGWTLESGYPKDANKDTFPRRALSAGAQSGYFLLMRAFEQDLDYVCRGPVQGFKIVLHHPAELPRVAMQYFRAPLNQEIVVAIKPDMMTTSEGLRNYDPHRRQCFFPTERQLIFFQNYTQQNCEIECLANFTLSRCGCVPFHTPHDLRAREVESGIKHYGKTRRDDQDDVCDCLPSCTSLTYNAETSQADFNWPKLLQAFKVNYSEMPGIQMTRVTLFFKEMQFITSERNELYGQTDFLANCGGLLGLFTGFSFLSIVEIVYFLSLRLICNVKRYGRHYWSGSQELVNNDAYIHKCV